ncbi:MAG: ABC transporter permease [Gemmataceae bacterium]|nr:ABC transporter permease [Gemmataceae bacterium]MCI0737421.1 ABC transporter permease [Gemmataceae bacterium]
MLGPIFGREWLTLPRRSRHYLMRSVYLGALWVLLLTIWQTSVGWRQSATLGDQARFGLLSFQLLTYVQLLLVLFFAALTAASAIAQEKDRRTFVLLLLTDMRNYEIVLGKLFGSLLQLVLFLAGTAPLLALLLLLGGIAPAQIFEALLVLATTGLAAGSLGGLVALWREKTFQALALTSLFLVLYLCLVQSLALLPLAVGSISHEAVATLQAWLQPFLALQKVVDPLDNTGPVPTAYGFAGAMLFLTLVLNGLGVWKLRVWNPAGEPIIQREEAEKAQEEIDRAKAHAAPGAVRDVWANPILWREIATRAYGRRPLMVKVAYFAVFALICYFAFTAGSGDWAAARGLVPVGILSMLLVAAQAVTAITNERDLGALDLLLVTDLTPREFIFGKLWGILYNVKEFLLPPLILTAVYAFRGLLASSPPGHPEMLFGKNLEAFLCIAIATMILFAFAMVLGLHVALRHQNSRVAILNTLGTVFFLSIGTLVCIYLILINSRFENQWLSFIAFIFTGIGGLWWVLSGTRPSGALTLASWACPWAVFYTVTNIIVGRPGMRESTDPLIPFVVTGGAFGFTLAAMLIPLLSEFDVALGRTSAQGE